MNWQTSEEEEAKGGRKCLETAESLNKEQNPFALLRGDCALERSDRTNRKEDMAVDLYFKL